MTFLLTIWHEICFCMYMSMLSLNIGTQQVQKQSLVITPQLQHAISILQMNNLELEKHLDELAESNPFIEVKKVNSEQKQKIKKSCFNHRPSLAQRLLCTEFNGEQKEGVQTGPRGRRRKQFFNSHRL